MAKNKQHHQQMRSQPAASGPVTTNGSPIQASPEALAAAPDIEKLERVEEIARVEHEETLPPVPPPPGVTVTQAIQRAWEAERILGAARRKTEDMQREVEQKERDLRLRREALDREEAELRKRRDELSARERGMLDKEASLAERELNAEQQFLEERRRITGGLEQELAVLRAQREALMAEVDQRRSTEEAEWRRRLEERAAAWRAEEDERAERWRREDEERARRLLQEDQERARAAREEQRRLAEELGQERERDRAERARSLADHRERLAEEERKLDERRAQLAEEERALRKRREEIQTDREVLDEDLRALEKRVERRAAARVAELEANLRAAREQIERASAERDRHWRELESRRELDRRFGGERPEEVLARLQQLERENDELRSKLRASLGEASARRLAELEKERSSWLEEETVLRARLAEAETRAGRQRVAAIELETLDAQREALETTKKLLETSLEELRAQVDMYTQADEKRNPLEALIAIDRMQALQVSGRTVRPLGGSGSTTLKAFASDLRQRIAHGVPGRTLHYSDRDVRCFLGGIAMSQLILLQGISGTGKTSLPLAFAGATGAGFEVVEVQAGWRDRQDLVGYYNAFHRHYYATNFLQALYRAGTRGFQDRLFLIVLDEINLSRVEQFFADFLSALEQPEAQRRLTLMNEPVPGAPKLMVEGRHLPIPPNVWFVGTANHDETTTEFADKTYDRAHVMELPRRDPKRDGSAVGTRPPREPISYQGLREAFAIAQKGREAEVQKVLDWMRAEDGIASLLDKRFRIGWGNRLERDAQQFVPVVVESGGTVGEALDHLLHTKVLRKLKDRHDVRARALEELRTRLEASWKDFGDAPTRSVALIDREIRAKQDEEAT